MSKYRAIKSNGFASKREEKRAGDLRLMEKLGLISDLKFQVKYELIPKQEGERAVTYTCDASYVENGQLVIEDSKGVRTQQYVIRRKLMLWVHGIRIREV
jgi:hypothetical protein